MDGNSLFYYISYDCTKKITMLKLNHFKDLFTISEYLISDHLLLAVLEKNTLALD